MADEMSKRIEVVSVKILSLARSELYLHMRFMDVALSTLRYVCDGSISTIGTDGIFLYYHPGYLGGLYRESRARVNRVYLHMILHCIFAHPWKKVRLMKKKAACELGIRQDEEREEADLLDILWDLSCDIAVESMIDGLYLHCVRMPMPAVKKEVYALLRKKRKVLNAENVFWALVEENPDIEKARQWRQIFLEDEHSLWKKQQQKPQNQNPKENWDDIRNKMETEMETFGQDEENSGSYNMLEQVRVENRDTYDYKRFLQKFAVLKEEPQVDPDTFDYTFYSYGLSLYGNMPLIEPQETKEIKKIEEFVIAIDTSMSCSGELVKSFLRETYSILRETESFFKKVNIHIIQCDERIQKDVKIQSEEELSEYMENLELSGQGGTDFRPVFDYVDQLVFKKEFDNLKGLIYFTDGKGIFPRKMPRYETAFVLMQKEYEEIEMPAWAIRIYLEQDEWKQQQFEKTEVNVDRRKEE